MFGNNGCVTLILFQNWKKELEKHREKLLGGNESSSKKKEVSYFQFGYSWYLELVFAVRNAMKTF